MKLKILLISEVRAQVHQRLLKIQRTNYFVEFNWGYKTDPSPGACLGLSGGVCNWPKGRALGGTSVINFMLYQRGHRRDFDGWAANGNVGWKYDEVLPYFKKSERIGIPELKHSIYHGHDGYLDVQKTNFRTKVLKTFLQSAGEVHWFSS